MPLLSQWLQSGLFEMTVIAYEQAFVYEQFLKAPFRLPLTPESIKRAAELSQAFEIVFRSLGQSEEGFSQSAHASLERTLNVLKQTPRG